MQKDYPQIEGYTIHQLLYESPKTRVFQGTQTDGTSVILKTLAAPAPSAKEITRFRNEYYLNNVVQTKSVRFSQI